MSTPDHLRYPQAKMLVEPIPENKKCLRCRRWFMSRDKIRNRICDDCVKSKDYQGVMDDATPATPNWKS